MIGSGEKTGNDQKTIGKLSEMTGKRSEST